LPRRRIEFERGQRHHRARSSPVRRLLVVNLTEFAACRRQLTKLRVVAMMSWEIQRIDSQIVVRGSMKSGALYMWALLALLPPMGAGIGHAAEIGWPEAIARLAGERTKAETCVGLLKRYGTDAQITRSRLIYAEAKANSDAVIAGLVTALAQRSNPESLQSLDAKLARGTAGLVDFCNTVADLLPSTAGQKSVLVDILKATIEPVLKSVSEAVTALYNNHRKDDALTRQTIQTQLEAAKWPDFAEVKTAS
jgi:hypothetical protein